MGKGYSRDIKRDICEKISRGTLTVDGAALLCGASQNTVKGWVKKYNADPMCFKRKDISGGLNEELQSSNGLIAMARSSVMPNEKEMSELAFKQYQKIHTDFDASVLSTSADEVLKELLQIENEIYQKKVSQLLTGFIPYYYDNISGTMEDAYPEMRKYMANKKKLYDSICSGQCSYEEYLEQSARLNAPVMHRVSFSIMQSSKARAGAAFEHSFERMLDYIDVEYETQQKEGEGKTITDIIIPSMAGAKNTPNFSADIECQTTLKDRYRLTLGKSSASQIHYYLATPTGVGIFNKRDNHDITLEKVEDIVLKQGVTLIVFSEVRDKIQRMLIENINSDNDKPTIQIGAARDLLDKLGGGIITFTQFFNNVIPGLMKYWSGNKLN